MHLLLKTNNFGQLFLIFQEWCFVEGCGFLRCAQCPKALNLSYQTPFGNIFKFLTIRGDPYGHKVTRSRKKVVKFPNFF